MWILGLAGSHNSGAALIRDGKVVVAVQTERLVRYKRQAIRLDEMSADTVQVIAYCLRYAGIDLPDLAAIATCTPSRSVHPRFALRDLPAASVRLPPFVRVPHHLAHAEYALHYAPQDPCLVLVCDGSGTFEDQRAELDIQEEEHHPIKHLGENGKESISAYRFDGTTLSLIYRVAYGSAGGEAGAEWLASLGHLWEWAASYCHGSRHEAGKVMGLAPFGSASVHADLRTIGLHPRGEVRIDFDGLLRRCLRPNTSAADISGSQHHQDIAAHVQRVTNDFLVDLVRFLQTRFDTKNVCYSGGVALNSIANEHLRRSLGINLHMNGSCEDNGTAIGAALAVYHARTGRRVPEDVTDYHGRHYTSSEVEEALRGYAGRVERLERAELLARTARALSSGLVVGWLQGRSEFGPRALGNRSILADPRDPSMQRILNERVKHREAFRPYAPAVVEERAAEFFDLEGPSPVMLRVVPVTVSSLPAITHVDGSARVQTVNRRQNPIFYDLLKQFEAETGVPVLLNTSFNVAGEPIVETPADALRTFIASGMDLLVMEDFMVHPPPSSTSPGDRS
ncbi:hypothetical protein BE08_23980 [Sorangium cellulosum]|uniref:Carbamoyltransferase n=1 Tax=Sorangium cellulosum TaxID=56 RepID=A0A150PDA9_SORCE|nr:hypothetical protein BE08_23980 [Sorangium cellulosum]